MVWGDQALPEEGTGLFTEHFPVEYEPGRCLCYPPTDMQGQEVFLPWVTVAGTGGSCPRGQPFLPFVRREGLVGAGIDQPLVESLILLVRRSGRAGEKGFEVVKGKSRADNQDILMAQRSQGLADGDVSYRVEAGEQRQLDAGNVRMRVHDFQRYKEAMIKTPPLIQTRLQTASLQ